MSQLKKNFIYNALLTTSSLILPFITFPYVTRILAPEGIGQVNFANSFIQYFVIIASLGVPFYGIREIAKVKDNIELRSKILFELFFIKLLFSLIAFGVYLFLIFSIPKFNNALPFYTWGIGIILIGIFDFNFFFSALEDFKYITIRTIIFQVVSVLLTFVLIRTKADTLKYFIIPIFISFVTTLVNFRYILKFIKFQSIWSKFEFKRHLKPLVLLFSIMLFSSIYNLLDTTILGFISSDEQVGFYSAASKINRIPISLLMVLVPVMLPRISSEFQNKNYFEIERLISKTIQFVILLGIPIMVGLFACAPEIISLLSGAEFAPSVTTLRILSPVAFIIGLTTNFSTQLLVPLGKDRQLLIAVILGTIVSLVFNFTLIPLLFQNGAAISNLVAEIVVLVACFFFASNFIKISFPFKQILITSVICLPFLGIIFAARLIFLSPLPILMATVFISVCYYSIIQISLLRNSIIIELKDMILKKVGNVLHLKSL